MPYKSQNREIEKSYQKIFTVCLIMLCMQNKTIKKNSLFLSVNKICFHKSISLAGNLSFKIPTTFQSFPDGKDGGGEGQEVILIYWNDVCTQYTNTQIHKYANTNTHFREMGKGGVGQNPEAVLIYWKEVPAPNIVGQ